MATIVMDAALDLLHTLCFDEVRHRGALCDKGLHRQVVDLKWDKLPACQVCRAALSIREATASWKLTPRRN